MWLSLFYLILSFVILNRWSFFKKAGLSLTWLNGLWTIKIIAGIAVYWIYTHFYTVRSEADIFRYFDDSAVVYNSFWKNPSDFFKLMTGTAPDNTYFFEEYYVNMNNWVNDSRPFIYGDSRLMIRMNALLRFISFGNFFVHSLIFSFLAYIGLLLIYEASLPLFQKRKYFPAFVIFCLPSVLFWTSSLLKESLLVFFLGIVYKNTFRSEKKTTGIYYIALSLLGILFLKFYVFVALSLPLIAVFISRYTKKASPITINLLVIISGFIIFLSIPQFSKVLVQKQHDFLVYNSNASSYFDIPLLENDPISIVKNIPVALFNSLTRPFPSSKLSLMGIPAVIENILLILALLLASPKILKPKNWTPNSKQSQLLFILTYTLILLAVIGLTTPVAGALVRYKVAILPFLSVFILYFIEKR